MYASSANTLGKQSVWLVSNQPIWSVHNPMLKSDNSCQLIREISMAIFSAYLCVSPVAHGRNSSSTLFIAEWCIVRWTCFVFFCFFLPYLFKYINEPLRFSRPKTQNFFFSPKIIYSETTDIVSLFQVVVVAVVVVGLSKAYLHSWKYGKSVIVWVLNKLSLY